jgi:hypothetical protein
LALISSCTDRREAISKEALQAQDSASYSHGNLAKQLILVVKGILKLSDSQRNIIGG